jgi:hypothetical protein
MAKQESKKPLHGVHLASQAGIMEIHDARYQSQIRAFPVFWREADYPQAPPPSALEDEAY